MLLQTKPKTILWVSKKSPPLILGANFDIQQSGRQALTKWKAGGYVVTMVDTGGLNDGLTGFDVLRNIRSMNAKSPVYVMVNNMNGPETVLASRLRANGVIPHAFNDIQAALRATNAINWAVRPGQTDSFGKRLFSVLRSAVGAKDTVQDETLPPPSERPHSTAQINVEEVINDLADLTLPEPPIASRNTLVSLPQDKSFAPILSETLLPAKAVMNYSITNPHQLSLQFNKLGPDYEEYDRQFAWELYTELATRVAVTGKASDPTCTNMDGELWSESFSSLLAFCKELRVLLRTFPAVHAKEQTHLGGLLINITKVVLNPFLDKWRVDFLHWWEYTSDKTKAPLQRQNMYPRAQDMLVEWRQLKMTLRAVQDTLEKAYKLNR